MPNKPTICIDFDGVIHSYTSGWQGMEEIPDDPVPAAFVALVIYLHHFEVAIYSSHSAETRGISAMKKWFRKHGFDQIDELKFPTKKPPAFVTIDDRAITFDGFFPTVNDIKEFKPWNQK